MRLREFQDRFVDLMLDHPDALDSPPADLAAFCEEGEIALPARLKVYRNNIVGSLTDLMVANFPILDRLVGRAFLELMARSFILKNPPQEGCISLYGQGFSEFIEEFEMAKALPYLPDIARYEIAVNLAYHARDDAPLSAEALAGVVPDDLGDLKLNLRESVKLMRSRFPIIKIQEFCAEDDPQGTLNVAEGGGAIMVYRPQLDSKTLSLAEDEYTMLLALCEGQSLGSSVESTMEAFPAFDFQGFLQKHIALETFAAL